MKILTKEEEQEHYNATLKGGFKGLATGLVLGIAGVYGVSHSLSRALQNLDFQVLVIEIQFLALSRSYGMSVSWKRNQL